jgi:hypothetical protein
MLYPHSFRSIAAVIRSRRPGIRRSTGRQLKEVLACSAAEGAWSERPATDLAGQQSGFVDDRESGIEDAQGSLQCHEGPEHACQLRVERQAELAEKHEQVVEHLGAGPGARAEALGEESGQGVVQRAQAGTWAGGGQLGQGVAQQLGVLPGDGHQQAAEGKALGRMQPYDRSEVDLRERAVGGHEDVAGMGIGVDHTCLQNLGEEGLEQAASQAGPVDAEVCQDCAGVAQRRAIDELQHQHPSGGELLEDPWYPYSRPFEELAHQLRVARFDRVIELLAEVLGEPKGQVRGPNPSSPVGRGVEPAGEREDDVEVALDEFLDTRALDLHDHLRPAVQPRAVHLADRGSSKRHRVEPLKGLVWGLAELRPQQPPDRCLIGGRDTILKYRQLLGGTLSQQVRARREHLPELHEHPARLLQGLAELHPEATLPRMYVLDRRRRVPVRQRGEQAMPPDSRDDRGVTAAARHAPLDRPDGMRDRPERLREAADRRRPDQEVKQRDRGERSPGPRR